MAQSNSFFGLRKGSTKSLTFQVLNGKQITKDRVFNVKNPQSLAQMQQRAIMATTIAAYSKLKTICDHSFEGIEIGTKTMSEFMRNNIKLLGANMPEINVTEYKSGVYVQNPYMISKGSLTPPNTSYTEGEFAIDTGIGGKEQYKPKWSDIAQALAIKKDGMLTLVWANGGDCLWLRIKFNEAMWNTEIVPSESNITQLAALNAIEGNSLEFDGFFVVKLGVGSKNNWALALTIEDGESAAAIVSEKAESIWKRSTAYLQGKFTYLYDAAFSTYPINTTLLLNGGKMSTNVITK